MNSRSDTDPDPTSGPITVLHVDDDRSVADLTAASLEGADDRFSVLVETRPADALETLEAEAVDCVVSDYRMPGMDGLDLLEAVREEYPDLPFILYTGHGSEAVASDALSGGATDYLRKGGGLARQRLLANRIENAVEGYRSRRHAEHLDRVQSLVREINRELVRASSRSAVESAVCDIISETEPYGFAWVGHVDPETESIEPASWAGVDEEYVGTLTVTTDRSETGLGPGGRAVRNRRLEVSQRIREDPAFEPWRDAAAERGVRSVAAVPIVHGGELYGLLVVGAERPAAFDGDERELLSELGDDIAHALDRLRVHEAVTAERDRRAALFENTPDPIMAVEFDDGVPYIDSVNGTFETVFGYGEREVAGRPVSDVLVPESDDEHDALRERVFRGERVEAEVRRTTADGERDFLLRIIPFDVGDGAGGAYAWYTDVTEQKAYGKRLESLNEASRRLMTAAAEREVAEVTVDLARTLLDTPLAAVWSYDADEGTLRPLAGAGAATPGEAADADCSVGVIDPGTAEMDAFRGGEMTVIGSYDELDAPALSDSPPESVLVAPLGEHGQLQVGSRTATEFTETTRDLVEILCQTAEAAFDRLARERTLNELNELTRELVRASSEAEIATVAAEAGEEVLGLPFTHLYLLDDDGETLRPVAAAADTTERFGDLPRFERGEGVLWEVFESGEPRRYRDVQAEAEMATDMPFRGAVIAPLGDRGVFASGSLEAAELDSFDRKAASILAATTEVALERTDQDRRLRERERKLEEARDRFRSVFEHSNDAIVIFDPAADEILEANPRASDLLGYSREELRRLGPSDVHPDEMERFRAFVGSIRADGHARMGRLSCVTRDGERVPAEISASTLEFDGRESVLASIRDVTDLREYERELERQNERLENFASVVSHDLRNPLNVAIGRVGLLAGDCDSEHVEPARSALDRIEEMIDDLLTLTRAGESVEDRERVDLAALVEGCWRNVDTAASELVVTTELTVSADESRLRNVLENLFRNAVEHAAGEVTVTVGELPDGEGFYVADTGPGIPPEERSDVFEQGYTTTDDGTGFGLRIAREIVEAHGWEIGVAESEDGGARFEIRGVEAVASP